MLEKIIKLRCQMLITFDSFIITLVSTGFGFGSSGALGHDYLVNLEDGASGAHTVLKAPHLGDVQVKDFLVLGIDEGVGLGFNVDSGVLLAILQKTNIY